MSNPTTVNWADLWDQIDFLASHTQKGIEHLEKYGIFLKERAAIEDEYATKLRALVKKNLGKKKEDDEASKSFTYISSFYSILHEIESLAAQHEVIAENLRRDIQSAVNTKTSAFRSARKTHLSELNLIHGNLNTSIDTLLKYQKAYCKAFKEAEMAHLKYDKVEKNMALSRVDVEKAKNNALQRTQMCEEAKQNYAHALQATNQQQFEHYKQLLPQILEKVQRLRVMDEERINETKSLMLRSVEVETKVMSIVQRCYDDMVKAVSAVTPSNDSASVVEQCRSGYAHPEPIPFEDLGNPSAIVSGEGVSGSDTMKKPSRNGTTIRVNRKPSMGFFKASTRKDGMMDFRALPPQQRCRRLQQEIETLTKEIAKNEQGREGAAKMLQVYRDNPKLGNANDVDSEISLYLKKIESLSQTLMKYQIIYLIAIQALTFLKAEYFQALLTEAKSELNMPISTLGSEPPARPPPPSSLSNPSQSSPVQSLNNHPTLSNSRCSYSEESVSSEGSAATNQKSSHLQTSKTAPVVEKCEVYEECEMPALGTCVALYTFEGGGEGMMAMEEGDEMVLTEKDEGDGWTRVRHIPSAREGFVPTSYLRCRWFCD